MKRFLSGILALLAAPLLLAGVTGPGIVATTCSNQFLRSLNASGSGVCSTVALATDTSGTLAVGRGGTGLTSLGSAGQVLKVNAGATALEYAADATGGGGGGSTVTRLVVSADQVVNSATYTNVTDLTLAVASATTYSFECHLRGTQSVAGDQFWVAVNGPASTWVGYTQIVFTSATAHTAVSATAYDATAGLPATGAVTAGLPHQVKGSFLPSASGTFAVRVRRDAGAGTTTVLRGSFCLVAS